MIKLIFKAYIKKLKEKKNKKNKERPRKGARERYQNLSEEENRSDLVLQIDIRTVCTRGLSVKIIVSERHVSAKCEHGVSYAIHLYILKVFSRLF